MRRLGTRNFRGHLAVGATVVIAAAAAAQGCGGGGNGDTSMATGGHPSSSSSTGGGHVACTTAIKGPTRGSAIAITSDDKFVVVANREAGSVSVMSVDYDSNGQPTMTKTAEVAVGGEPWQVAIDGCDDTAYVVLRKDQKVVEITNVTTKPAKGREASVGSEPTSLALTPYNSKLYVANSVEGTLSVIDPVTMKSMSTVDLNAALVADPKYLGTVKARPSLAHPRSIAITNSGGADDEAEKVYVTEFFAQQIAVEASDATNADLFKAGLVYSVKVADGTASVIELGPIADTGFDDTNKAKTGCYPNQLQSIALDGKYAYVTSICASPRGPLGVLNGTKVPPPPACTVANQDTVCGSGGVCDTTTLLCKPNLTNVKGTTHPAVSVFDTGTDTEVTAGTTNLDKNFSALYFAGTTPACAANDGTCRFPHIANDMAFLPSTGVAYVSANGADAVFRVHYDPATGTVKAVGSEGNKPNFINLSPAALSDPKLKGQNPIGIVVANSHAVAFTANDVTRNVTAIDLGQQSVADTFDPDPTKNHSRVTASSALPTDPAEQSRLRGKHFFNTGLGRWSLKGQGWGSCQACHQDGLSDNVTWYFNRGPRQSVSLDGSFSKTDPDNDRRIFNWGAIFDEVADFENNTRGVSGGVGALVSHDPSKDTPPTPPALTDRIAIDDTVALPPAGAVGLNGSTIEVTATSAVADWTDITNYMKSIRSPRAPNTLDPAEVAAGETLFKTGGFCQGCHGGDKWTISKVFYTPSGATNAGLLTKTWDPTTFAGTGPGKFPTALLPATTTANQVMRFGGANPAGLDQILCILRPVGTFNLSEPGVGIAELRQDGKPAQGAAVDGNGFNPPSLLGLQVAAPYFHSGGVRTLEAMFSANFGTHWKALAAANFLVNPADVDKLVAYLLSIDNSTKVIAPPATPGDQGGNFCAP